MKSSEILGRTDSSLQTEKDFGKTCALFENQKFESKSQINQAYEKYISSNHKITSLSLLYRDGKKTFLHAFDTEKETAKMYKVNVPKLFEDGVCIAVLPNGELFCFGDLKHRGITFILNRDYEVRFLPTGEPLYRSSAIYFNRSIYCFGGLMDFHTIASSSKYDLDKNRWVKLAPMASSDWSCSCVIFKGNILISGNWCRNLMIYSIYTNSFSIIPCFFKENTKKLLINAERLYLIECIRKGFIWENDTGDEYRWKKVVRSNIGASHQIYSLYNKGRIYIIAENKGAQYYKFDLNLKKVFKL